jgi:DNA-directed RNA polymerase subunit beta'
MIKSWSYGEVKKPETINYRTLNRNATVSSANAYSGRLRTGSAIAANIRGTLQGKICERCGVEVTKKAVRREAWVI